MNVFSTIAKLLSKNGYRSEGDKLHPVSRVWGKFTSSFFKIIPPPVAILLYASIGVIFLFPYSSTIQRFDLPKEGDIATETVIAPFTFDIVKTPDELAREQYNASAKVLLVLEYDTELTQQIRRTLLDLRDKLYALAKVPPSDSIALSLVAVLNSQLSDASIRTLHKNPHCIDGALSLALQLVDKGICSRAIVASKENRLSLQNRYNVSFDDAVLYDKDYVSLRRQETETMVPVSSIPFKEDVLETIVKRNTGSAKLDQSEVSALYELFTAALHANVMVNENETALRKQKAISDVLLIKGKVVKETEIVRKHQVVTLDIVERLYSLRKNQEQLEHKGATLRSWANNIGKLLLLLLALFFLGVYLKKYHKSFTKNDRNGLALATIVLFQIVIIHIGLLIAPRLFEAASDSGPLILEYLIPTSAGAMLAMILFDIRVSFIVSLFTAIFFGVVSGFSFQMFLLSFFTSITAGYCTKNIRYRWDFIKAIPPVFLVYSIMILILEAIGYHFSFVILLQSLGLAIGNCVAATFFVMVATMVFENLFDISTDMTLIELSDMNNPLLKRLSIEAAGTYNHCVLVGNLAESAAEKIGANSLLARVASYYHDVGKIEKADYFIENASRNDKSRHARLAPTMSALIISSHVKDGVELARRYKMPRIIRDAILQHHGKSTVSYFYEKARQLDPHNQVQEETFKYPGPLPQTRENAIIMLADSVEAASRSLATSSPKLLRDLVRKIIRDKFSSGQLDQCDLTLRDLDDIIEGFMPILQGIFHTRDTSK